MHSIGGEMRRGMRMRDGMIIRKAGGIMDGDDAHGVLELSHHAMHGMMLSCAE